MAEENEGTDTTTATSTENLSWDSLRAAWEEGGLNPAQVQGRLEASRKWESRAKAAPSGEELATLREKAARADALDNDLATDTQRAAKEAREAATTEVTAKLRNESVEDAFRLVIGDRKTDDEITDFLSDLNLPRFVGENGRVDTAKVRARAEQYAPATGNQQQQNGRKGPTATVHGSGSGSGRTGGGSVAQVMADRRAEREAKSS